MAIMSDFFTAAPDQITRELVQTGPHGTVPVIAVTSFTTLEMALLLHVVRGGRLDTGDDAVAGMDEFEDLFVGGPEGPWQSKFPPVLRDALAAASASELADYAGRWAEAEELAGMDQETVRSLLRDLGNLARSAQADGRDLYLWVSL